MLAAFWLPGAPQPALQTQREAQSGQGRWGAQGCSALLSPGHSPGPPPFLCSLEGVKCHSCGVPGDSYAPRSCRRPFCRRGAGAASSRQLSEDLWSVQSQAGAQQPVLGRAAPYPAPTTAARPCPRHRAWHLLDTAGCQVTLKPMGPTQPPSPQHCPGPRSSGAEPSRARLRSRRRAAPLPRDHST